MADESGRARRWSEGWLVFLGLVVSAGCGGPATPLDLSSLDPAQDQWAIAAYHSREAAALKQRADEMRARAAVYERLFGPESEWVLGTRQLADFYEQAAQEQERLAERHVGLVGGKTPLPPAGAPAR